jgi:anti-sigma B factor antagonist
MLTVSQRTIEPQITLVEACGRITMGRNAQELEWTVDNVLQSGATRIIVDLSEVAHIDSTGIGILVMCAGKVAGLGGKIRIAGAHGSVEHVLHLCKIAEIVPLCATVADAAASITSSGAAA